MQAGQTSELAILAVIKEFIWWTLEDSRPIGNAANVNFIIRQTRHSPEQSVDFWKKQRFPASIRSRWNWLCLCLSCANFMRRQSSQRQMAWWQIAGRLARGLERGWKRLYRLACAVSGRLMSTLIACELCWSDLVIALKRLSFLESCQFHVQNWQCAEWMPGRLELLCWDLQSGSLSSFRNKEDALVLNSGSYGLLKSSCQLVDDL